MTRWFWTTTRSITECSITGIGTESRAIVSKESSGTFYESIICTLFTICCGGLFIYYFFRNNVITLPIMKLKKKITKDKQLIKPRSQYHKQNIRYIRQFYNPRCRTQFVSINVQLGPSFERFTNLNRIHQIYLSNCLIVANSREVSLKKKKALVIH